MAADIRSQVLQAADLVELISQTVALKRTGKSYVGLCPFHQEKTPSFHVNPGRQTFYCFGCKAGGTAFDFVMRRDRVEFREALEILARQAGIDLPQFGGPRTGAGERQALIDANSAACRFFENLLWQTPQGASAREYLAQRSFADETLKRFQVGLAADSWDALLKGPVGRKFGPQVLQQAGLVKLRDRGDGHYDTFRNRIMFPIRSESGQIIAFGGRVVPGSQDPAKYLNSPETPLFSKSRCIYGLDFARQRIVETRTAVVVEGYCDVVAAQQFGAMNVVSVLGTAMTEQHVTILRRFADRIVLLFDADSAGDLAADRVVQLFLSQPVDIAVASMPDGLDPDEFLVKYGLPAFDRLVAEATDALGFAWKQLCRKFSGSSGLTDQQKAASEYVELLAKTSGGPVDSIRLGAALARVSRLTEIPLEQLHQRCRPRRSGRAVSSVVDKNSVENTTASRAVGHGDADDRAPTGQELAERWILGYLLLWPKGWQQVQATVAPDAFAEGPRRRLAELYWSHQRDEGEPVLNEFIASLPEDSLKTLAIELAEEAEELVDLDLRLNGALEHLTELRRKRQSQQALNALIKAKDHPLSTEEEIELLKQVALTKAKPDARSLGPRVK